MVISETCSPWRARMSAGPRKTSRPTTTRIATTSTANLRRRRIAGEDGRRVRLMLGCPGRRGAGRRLGSPGGAAVTRDRDLRPTHHTGVDHGVADGLDAGEDLPDIAFGLLLAIAVEV